MCCCGNSEEIDDLPVVDGVIDFRGNHGCCRDFYCLLLFVAATIGMIVVFSVGFSTGQPEKLIAPIDKDGGFCGLTENKRDKSFDCQKNFDKSGGAANTSAPCSKVDGCIWGGNHDPAVKPVDVNLCYSADKGEKLKHIVYYNISAPTEGICVEACPTPTKFCVMKNGTLSSQDYKKCVLDPDSEYFVGKLNLAETIPEIEALLNSDDSVSPAQLLSTLGVNANFVIQDSIELMNRCIPNVHELLKDINLDDYDGLNNVFTAAVSDVSNAWWLFLIAAGITLVLCFAAICCLQCCAKCITWFLIIAGILLVFVVGAIALIYGLKSRSDAAPEHEIPTNQTSSVVFIIFGAVTLVAGLILLIILIALRDRISLAATLVQEASRAIKSNLCMLTVPLVYAAIFIVVVVLLLFTMVYYFSSLDIDRSGRVRSIQIKDNDRIVVLLCVLYFWWVTFLIIGFNQYTIAGTGAYYYFARKPEDRPAFPVARTVLSLVLHHIGSIAVGSFLIALVATARTVLLYFAEKAKAAKNEQLKCLISCLQCCLGCLQKVIEFIASRAYIMMAIQGKNFWVSAFDALKLLLENPIRTSFLTAISKFLIIMAEVFVTALSVLICFFILRPDMFSDSFTSKNMPIKSVYWWFVAFVCAIIAFFLAWIVFQIYESLIDTLFFCFLYDEHMEKKYNNSYLTYASEDLRKYMSVVDENAKDIENGGNGDLTQDRSSGGGDSSRGGSSDAKKGNVDY